MGYKWCVGERVWVLGLGMGCGYGVCAPHPYPIPSHPYLVPHTHTPHTHMPHTPTPIPHTHTPYPIPHTPTPIYRHTLTPSLSLSLSPSLYLSQSQTNDCTWDVLTCRCTCWHINICTYIYIYMEGTRLIDTLCRYLFLS
jgi:hypothetical protein